MDDFTQKGDVGIKINDQIGRTFCTWKGLRQGHPLSQILFNITVVMLAILINRAKIEGQIAGVVPHGLSILQYDDDTILFMDHDIEKNNRHEIIVLWYLINL